MELTCDIGMEIAYDVVLGVDKLRSYEIDM